MIQFFDKWESYTARGGLAKVYQGLDGINAKWFCECHEELTGEQKSLNQITDKQVKDILWITYEFDLVEDAVGMIQALPSYDATNGLFSKRAFENWLVKLRSILMFCKPEFQDELLYRNTLKSAISSRITPVYVRHRVAHLNKDETSLDQFLELVKSQMEEQKKIAQAEFRHKNDKICLPGMGAGSEDELLERNKKAKGNTGAAFVSLTDLPSIHSVETKKPKFDNNKQDKKKWNKDKKHDNMNSKTSDQRGNQNNKQKPNNNSARSPYQSNSTVVAAGNNNNSARLPYQSGSTVVAAGNNNNSSDRFNGAVSVHCRGCNIRWTGNRRHWRNDCPLKNQPGWGNPKESVAVGPEVMALMKTWADTNNRQS